MSKLKTIQEVVEKKARDRAESEVSKALTGMKILRGSKVFNDQKITVDGKETNLRSAFWTEYETLPKKIIDELTDKYIPEEVKKFVDDVERVKKDVDDLYHHSQNF